MKSDLSISTLVDTLGDIDKQIKELQIQEKQIKDQIKDLATLPDGKKTYIGQAYIVTIGVRTNFAVDYKAFEAATGLTKADFDAHKTIPTTSLIASVSAIL